MAGMARQLRDNLVAITSLVVALSALGYNTWRNELTERNRNIRVAGIELLKELGSLQQLVLYIQFEEDEDRRRQQADPRMGWADVITINDLATVMPSDVMRNAEKLRTVWDADAEGLAERKLEAFRRIDSAIHELRQATLASLRDLK
jgi:hypothetical protein